MTMGRIMYLVIACLLLVACASAPLKTQDPNNPEITLPEKSFIEGIKIEYGQSFADCLPVALEAIFKFYDVPIERKEISDQIQKFSGTYMTDAIIFVKIKGLNVYYFTDKSEDKRWIKYYLSQEIPVLVVLGDTWGGHAAVLVGYDEVKRVLYVADPERRKIMDWNYMEFDEGHRTLGNQAFLIYPPSMKNLEITEYSKAAEEESLYAQAYAVAYLALGKTYDEKHEYDRSISEFSKVIEIYPEYEEAYFRRGNAYYSKGQFDPAILDYTKVLEINPGEGEAYFSRGSAYMAKREYDQAISDYTNAIEIDPKDSRAYYNRGISYSAKGQYDQAISNFTKVLEIDPKNAGAFYNRGKVYGRKSQFDESIANYTKAIEMDPNYAQAHYDRGNAYRDNGQYDQAISDYLKAIELNPKYVAALNSLAWFLATADAAKFRDGKKALEVALRACELTEWKNPSSLDTLAAAYARVGDFESAIRWQEKALELFGKVKKADVQQRLDRYRMHKPWPAE